MPWSSFPWRRESWRVFWRQRGVFVPLMVALLAIVASWLVTAAIPVPSGEGRILRYSVYVGANWISSPWVKFLPPFVATLFVGINIALGYLIARRALLAQRVWLWSAALIGLGFLWLALLLVWFNS